MQDHEHTLVDWIEIPSVTGQEGDYGDAVARALEQAGFDVERQQVAPGRFNVLARTGAPEIVFCTHLDTVPPFIPSRADREFIHGRGACDAKGQALSMLLAAELLLEQGVDRIGLLFTVGEETDSAGAAHANERLADPWRPRYTIVGEPTGLEFVRGHKGTFKGRLVARGTAGHSSQPGGPSAVHELCRTVARLLAGEWGTSPLFGAGTLNVGTLCGGVAANVVAAEASADLLVRVVDSPAEVERRLRAGLSEHVALEVGKNYGPVEFHVPAGEPAEVVAFGTDAPHLPRWGTPLLCGPGSILDAHTDHEKIRRADLARAAQRYVELAHALLAREDAR